MRSLINSSGVTNNCTLSQYSAKDMASFTLVNAFFRDHLFQSGHRPGAIESTSAPNAIPVFQSVVKLDIDNVGILLLIQTKSLQSKNLLSFVLLREINTQSNEPMMWRLIRVILDNIVVPFTRQRNAIVQYQRPYQCFNFVDIAVDNVGWSCSHSLWRR